MTSPAAGSLPALLAEVPDPRGRKGRRHPLAATLAATVCGILTGARGCEVIAQWVRNQDRTIWHALGFYRKPPCANMYRKLLRRLPAEALETAIALWMKDLVADPLPNDRPKGVALDGKTLCGTLDKHARSIHLLSLFDHQTAGVLRQLAMPPDTNEHKAALSTAADLLDLNRGHWGIENRLHWVRDVSFGEDACRANAQHCPQNLAALRNVGLTLLRAAGVNEILSTLRDFATRPLDLLKFLRIMKQ